MRCTAAYARRPRPTLPLKPGAPPRPRPRLTVPVMELG
jgi:hypothetical protein